MITINYYDKHPMYGDTWKNNTFDLDIICDSSYTALNYRDHSIMYRVVYDKKLIIIDIPNQLDFRIKSYG